jgi:hypothetical protein
VIALLTEDHPFFFGGDLRGVGHIHSKKAPTHAALEGPGIINLPLPFHQEGSGIQRVLRGVDLVEDVVVAVKDFHEVPGPGPILLVGY